jgi:hypothetical protein
MGRYPPDETCGWYGHESCAADRHGPRFWPFLRSRSRSQPPGNAKLRAGLARACTAYTVRVSNVQLGHRWVFNVRVHDLVVHRTRCGSGVRSLIARRVN